MSEAGRSIRSRYEALGARSREWQRTVLSYRGVTAALVASALSGQIAAAQIAPPSCEVTRGMGDAAALLDSAKRAMGVPESGTLVMDTRGRSLQDYQSDRTYPPFFSAMIVAEHRYDAATGAEQVVENVLFPRGGPPPRTLVLDHRSTWFERGGSLTEVGAAHRFFRLYRDMNPWAITDDWRSDGSARAIGTCLYRDHDRVVLERTTDGHAERLLLDADTHIPVKLDRWVLNDTWGQQHEEVVWSTWITADGDAIVPSASFVLHDGRVVRERTVGEVSLDPSNDTPVPSLPDEAEGPPLLNILGDPEQMRPDTVRLGDDAYLLAHPFYNNVVVASQDTVWVLDATLNQARSREDAAWIERLFGSGRTVAVVVTDLAWPHIGGVRWWVSQGATVFAHPSAEPFLRSIVERRWHLEPDDLETRRAAGERVPFRFLGVAGTREVAAGRLQISHMGGLSTEGALMVYDTRTRFLWAGDWIQFTDRRSQYAGEVVAAAAREGIEPLRVGAQHIDVTDWAVVRDLNAPPSPTRQ